MNLATLKKNFAVLIKDTVKQLLNVKSIVSSSFKLMQGDIASDNIQDAKNHLMVAAQQIASPLSNIAQNIFIYLPITALGILYEICREFIEAIYCAFTFLYEKSQQAVNSFVAAHEPEINKVSKIANECTSAVKGLFNKHQTTTDQDTAQTAPNSVSKENFEVEVEVETDSIYDSPVTKLITTMYGLMGDRVHDAVFGTYGSDIIPQTAGHQANNQLPKDKSKTASNLNFG